jgi:hypothetical protein
MADIGPVRIVLDGTDAVVQAKRLCALISGPLQKAIARVEEHEPWTPEGQAAVARVWRLFRRMRKLAAESGVPMHAEGVEKLIRCYLGTVPALSWPFDQN